jgi:hypothetical protein
VGTSTMTATLTVDLRQRGDEVKGTLTGEVVTEGGRGRSDQPAGAGLRRGGGSPAPALGGESIKGEVSGRLTGWVLDGKLQVSDGKSQALSQRIRWTFLNQEFQQFQGTAFGISPPGLFDYDTVFLDDNNCGARRGSPLPQPCREPSGLIFDRFPLPASPGTDQWDALDNAPTKEVAVGSGDFRATVTATATTTNHVQVVGLGVTASADGPKVWTRITKGFSTDVNPPAVVSVQRRSPSAMLLPPLIPYTADTVHFMIERRGDLMTLSYGPDGEAWTVVQRDMPFPIRGLAVVYAVAYSSRLPMPAEFTDFKVTRP